MNPVENYKAYTEMDAGAKAKYKANLERSADLQRKMAAGLKDQIPSGWSENDPRRVQNLANAAAFEANAAASETFLREIQYHEMDPQMRERFRQELIPEIKNELEMEKEQR